MTMNSTQRTQKLIQTHLLVFQYGPTRWIGNASTDYWNAIRKIVHLSGMLVLHRLVEKQTVECAMAINCDKTAKYAHKTHPNSPTRFEAYRSIFEREWKKKESTHFRKNGNTTTRYKRIKTMFIFFPSDSFSFFCAHLWFGFCGFCVQNDSILFNSCRYCYF